LVHPVTRGALDSALKKDITNTEGLANEGVEVYALGEDVATKVFWGDTLDRECIIGSFEDFLSKEGDLAFVVFFEAEVAVAPDAFALHTAYGLWEFDRIVARRLPVVTSEVVAWGDVECQQVDLHIGYVVPGSWFLSGLARVGWFQRLIATLFLVWG
jgi:hypothetical protein